MERNRKSGTMGMKAARTGRRGRRAGVWLAAAVLAVLAALALSWWWAEQRLEGGLEDWAAARRADGWTVRSSPPIRAGWPLAARLVLKDVDIEGGQADLPGGFAWRADQVTLSVSPRHPRLLVVTAEGPQRLRVGALPEIPYTAGESYAETPLGPDLPADATDITAREVRADVGGSLTIGLLRAHADLRPAARPGEPALALSASSEAIGLPPGVRWALGGRISSVIADAVLSGPLPPVAGLARRAAAWRDGGGTASITRLALGWGPLGLTGGATLRLDARLQPTGTGSARIVGYAATLDALSTAGAIGANAALAMKALAGLIAVTPEGGGPAEIEVPLSLQDRVVSVRQIPLARIPEVSWPAD